MKLFTQILALAGLVSLLTEAFAFQQPASPRLPNFDKRTIPPVQESTAPDGKAAAVAELRKRLPNVRVDFHPVTRSPKMIMNRDGFLSGPGGSGGAISGAGLVAVPGSDTNRITKAFVREHSQLFGHGPEALEQARITRGFVTAHNGMRTVVWEQQVDEIPVFEAIFISHTTSKGELVNIASQFIANPQQAADRGVTNRAALLAKPVISAQQAVTAAAGNAGEAADLNLVTSLGATTASPEKTEKFTAPFLLGEAEAKLTWLPMDEQTLRLCWDVTFTSRKRGEMFRILVDAETGMVQVRHGLTDYLSDATYRVFTSDSPSPFSPGYSTPVSTQPPLVSRSLVTLSAIDTNASPLGWINDGGNETLGNNVDAHTDINGDNFPDLPRPQGSPDRVFDFALDLTTQNPSAYSQAAVVQLFYWNNFMHDKLYELGFTEAAGNFQSNNFGRGGLGNDAVQADAQDGGGFNNANFSTPADGSPGRMQMYIFNSPTPQRDGDLDAEVVLHEYTHGLSNRRVGGGVGISALQTTGMGEGWSDFYGLSLLSEAGDDVNGVYAAGAYVTYRLSGMTQNYYFGIRRYPYCTDMSKNPLTFKDIDPGQASTHTGIPRSSIVGTTADEVHNQGEVWCVMLWEARANLITKYGWTVGNQRMLQLVTDGMNLSPANPNFLQARDAIIQADLVDNGGANRAQLWAAFVKRGMGLSATSPASSTTTGLHEAYDVPDDLQISPMALSSSGPVGGPFTPNPGAFTLLNAGTNALNWSLANTNGWFTLSPVTGTLAVGATSTVSVLISATATNFPLGSTNSIIWFTNQSSGIAQSRTFALSIVGRTLFENFEPDIHELLWSGFGGTLGSTVIATNYGGSVSGLNSLWFGDAGTRSAATIPVNTSAGGTISFYLRLGNSSYPWEEVDIPGEGIVLEYSTNNGASWTLMGTYDTSTFYSWTQVTTNIPTGALSAATQFRWRQLSHSGTCCDHWALDDISIDAGPVPPSILTQPLSQTVKSGSNVAFTVSGQGSFPLIYQWRKSGTNLLDGGRISGATNATLNISTLLESDSGDYSVVITNIYGSVMSSNATLLVTPLDHFEWSAISSPQAAGVPFDATITAKDFLNATVTNFNGTVSLSGSASDGPRTNTILGNLVDQTNLWGGSYTFGFAFTPNTNIVVTHVRSYSGTKVSIWQTNGTLLASQNVASVPGNWVETPLATPLTLNAGSTYVVGFYSGGQTNYSRSDRLKTFPNGTIVDAFYYLSSADGFPSNVVTGSTVYLVDLRYTVNAGAPVLLSPSSAGLFTNGMWNGMLTVQGPATKVILRADEAGGHSGLSNPFDVLLQNDLSISISASPDPVAVGANLIYALSIANVGPSTANAVTVTNILPPGVTFVSANSSQGSCTQSAGVVTCNLGTVSGGTNASVTIVVVPNALGALTNTATVTRAEADPYSANNSAVSVTTVLTPSLSIADASVIEGNSGQTNIVFAVQLSPPSPLTVTINYGTSNGSAQAGSDYASTNGILIFAPGETNHLITVAVIGDTNSEGSETFFMNLSSPTNATIGRGQAVGTILDDDSITVAVFDNPLYVDTTSGGVSAESDNVQASLTNRNFRVVTFANITAAVSANNVLLFPEFEVRSLAPDLTATERGALSSFVANGGLMIVHGQGANAGAFINAVFGLAVVESGQSSGGTVYTRTVAAAGTHFADAPASIIGNNGQSTLGLSSLPAGGLSIYENSGQSAVAEILFGGGKIIYLGWDWYDAVPIGTQDGGWLTVLESAVLELGPVTPKPPGIISQPGNQTVPLGGAAAFTVAAVGTPPVSYQWRKDGTNLADGGRINGVESNRLTIANVQTNDAGSYTVIVSNAYGSAVSSNAMLVVTIGGTAVTLTITPASPTTVDNCIPFGATTYKFTGFIYRNVPSFSIAPGDRLRFDLGRTNDLDIRRNIYVAQANVNPAAGGSSQGVLALAWVKVVADSQVPINPRGNNTTGDYELTYTVEAPFNFSGGGLIIGFSGSPPGSYPDATCDATLVGTTASDASGSFHRRFFDHQEQDTGILDTTNSDTMALGGFIVEGVRTAPLILAQPQSQAVRPGTNVSLCVTAAGAFPLTYQWRKDGTNLVNGGRVAGATDTCLMVSTAAESDSGQYSVVITNNYGSVTSAIATLLVTSLDHFEWSVISSPQAAGVPFGATITAKDFENATVTNFNGVVALSALAGGQTTNTILAAPAYDSSGIGSATLGYSFTPNTTITVTHVRYYFGTKVSIWTDGGVLLAAQNVTSAPGTWMETGLPTPIQLSAGVTYRVAAYSGGGYYYAHTGPGGTFPDGTINQGYQSSGDAFPVNFDSRSWLVDLRYTVNSRVPASITPTVSGNFTNGIWSGDVTVQQLATNVVLLADAGAGHSGSSNPFDMVVQNDLSVSISDVPDPVSVGANLTYTLAVTNTGPPTATGVMLTNFLPANTTFSSATVSQGTYTQSAGVVVCNLGTIQAATNASVSIVVVPAIAGTVLTNTAIISRAEPESYLSNNIATAFTSVTQPAISIADAAVAEGDSGATSMVFTVSLAASSAQTITVDYWTSDGSAAGGSDYVATNGSLTFPPGTTNLSLTVTVVGDKTVESNETFVVNLSSPVNGVLGRSQGVGTIINDDGLPGFLDHFAWNAISSPQAVGVPFSATITAKDFFNSTVTNFNGVVALSAPLGPGLSTNTILAAPAYTSSGSGNYTLGYSFTPNSNLTLTHVRDYYGTKVSIWTDSGVLLYAQNVTSTPGIWRETPVPPIELTAGATYRVAAYTGGGSFFWRTDLGGTFPDGTINQSFYSSGDAFPDISDSAQWWFVDLRYTVQPSVPITPPVSGNFTNGIWSGNATVQQLATNVVLQADDGRGHAGFSNPFDLVLQNDLYLTMSDLPDPVSVGANLTYALSITNTGPTDATSVRLTNFLPANVTFGSATVSQGTYTQSGGLLICDLGTVPGATNATVSIVVVPTLSGGVLTNTASVSRAEPEAYLSNNVATTLTAVIPPAISIADAAVVEGNVGTTNMLFAVTLNVPSAQTITVNYATANGTALAGSDYTATNGIVTFAPGTTNQSVLVRVSGDVLIEGNETLLMNLFNPGNGVLARNQATGTIINDDGLPGQIDHFAWQPISSPQMTNLPFLATITALDASNVIVTNFNMPVNLSATQGGVPITPTVSDGFSNGVWSGAIAVQAFATNLVLRADDGDGHLGSSNPFHVITSNQPPVILASPTNAVAYLGGMAGFQANILASAPLSYQWRFNGTDIAAATNSTLNLNRVTLSQAGNYSVVVWNPFGTNSTAKATLSVVQVVAWGAGTNNTGLNFNYGQSVVPIGVTNAIQLSGGLYHSLVVKADGTISAWGAGAINTQISPHYGQSAVPPLGSTVASAGGGYHSLGLRADGTLAAWGAGTNNLLTAPRYGQCILPSNSTNVIAIAAGDYHSVALRRDGRVLVWGYNGFGQTNVPTAATSNVVAIASRASHVLALKSDGSLVHWGSLTSLPTGVSNIVTIAAGSTHCLALKSDGTVVSFGTQTTVPAGLSNVVDVAAGADHNLALRSDGTIVTWGATNLYGRYQIPAGLSNFVGIACGYYHSLGLLGDGSPLIKWQPVSRSVLLSNPASFYVLGVGSQLVYQWQLNGTNIPSATNSTYSIQSVQALDAGNYQAIVANTFGAITSAVANLTVLAPIGAALDALNLTWSTSGNGAWFGETSFTHDGVDAAQSGRITNSQQSTVQANVSGPGVLNFWWKVSSEQFFDYLNFFVDGAQQASVSGEIDWQFQTFAIGSGVHTLKWTYQKDSSVSAGLDAGWLDQVQYTTNPPVITLQPLGQTNWMGATFSLNISASGAPPIAYQWLKAGTNVTGAVSSAFNIINATRRDSAAYSVVASNPGGSTASSNAVVLIRVPQWLKANVQPDGSFALTSGDADGGLLSLEDVGRFESQVSSNLVDWMPLTNDIVLTNGMLLLIDQDSTNYPMRFYRVIEH